MNGLGVNCWTGASLGNPLEGVGSGQEKNTSVAFSYDSHNKESKSSLTGKLELTMDWMLAPYFSLFQSQALQKIADCSFISL